MPRNSAGVYALPPSNPVIPFTTIATSWANPTMSDIASELTNSLDRTGRGGMLAPFRIYDGNISQPGLGFTNEVGLGLWRSGPGVMQFVAAGTNLFRIDSPLGAAVSPQKFLTYGQQQYRTPGQKWWQITNPDGRLFITPSDTADAEDFNATKAMTLDASGNLVIRGGLSIAGSSVFNNINGIGNLQNIGTAIFGDCTVPIANAAPPTPLQARSDGLAGSAAFIGLHRPNFYATLFGLDTDNELKFGGWSEGAIAYRMLHEKNAFDLNTANVLHAKRSVLSDRSIVGNYAWLGAVNGAVDLRANQTAGVGASSTITSVTMYVGQVARILVASGGPITISQGNWHWAIGSPVWGTAYTIVNIFSDSGSFWASTTPFNS